MHQEAAKEAEKGEELKGLAVSVLRAYMAFELSRNTREKVEAGGGGARAAVAVAVAAVLNAALEHEPPLPHEVFLSLSHARARVRPLDCSPRARSFPLPSPLARARECCGLAYDEDACGHMLRPLSRSLARFLSLSLSL